MSPPPSLATSAGIGPPNFAKLTITSLASRKSACRPIIVSALDRRMTFSNTRMAATGSGMEERLLFLVADDDDGGSLSEEGG